MPKRTAVTKVSETVFTREQLRVLVMDKKKIVSIADPADEKNGYVIVYFRCTDKPIPENPPGELACMLSYQKYKHYQLREHVTESGNFDRLCDEFLKICASLT